MPTETPPPNTRPQHTAPTTAQFAVKVRIIGTPTAADLDKVTESVASGVGQRLRASRLTSSPATEAELTHLRAQAEWLHAADAEAKLRAEGPPTILNPRYRWQPLADLLRRVASRSGTDPATYVAVADAITSLYRAARDEAGSVDYRIGKSELLETGMTAEDIAEVDRIFTATGFAPEGTPVRDWAIDDGTGTAWILARRKTEREANSIARGLRARQQATVRQQAEELIWGLLYALGGAKRGSASANLVVPRAGAADGPARTYLPRTGASKDTAAPFAGLVPAPPGEVRSNIGFQRELAVARLTGGRLARSGRVSEGGTLEDLKLRFQRANGESGAVDVDVIGPQGDLILVGGPGKSGAKMSLTIQRIADLKLAAAQRRVGALAYFTSDTPKDVLDKAIKHLGADNVRLFDAPQYREPPR